MIESLTSRLALVLGETPRQIAPLAGGCVGEVYAVHLSDGSRVVAKVDNNAQPKLHIEAYMLRYLAENSSLPVPSVIHSASDLLIISFVKGENRFSTAAQSHAAELLAALHNIAAPEFGLESDTLIGGLHQPNPCHSSWLVFFRDQRLLSMGKEGLRAGRLPESIFDRLTCLAADLSRWLSEPARPGLIHGDVWTGNVLAANEQISGFLDPAIYFADPEMELAFISLFNSFGRPFFARYEAINPIRAGFYEERSKLYNLYPLLVHVRLFGDHYVHSVTQTLAHFGY